MLEKNYKLYNSLIHNTFNIRKRFNWSFSYVKNIMDVGIIHFNKGANINNEICITSPSYACHMFYFALMLFHFLGSNTLTKSIILAKIEINQREETCHCQTSSKVQVHFQ